MLNSNNRTRQQLTNLLACESVLVHKSYQLIVGGHALASMDVCFQLLCDPPEVFTTRNDVILVVVLFSEINLATIVEVFLKKFQHINVDGC